MTQAPPTTDLATVEADYVVLSVEPVTNNRSALARYQQMQEFVQSVMVPGEDYGKIPNTKKPTLFKPGAEKLAEMYGLAITLPAERRRSVEDWERGFWHYEVTAVIVSNRTHQVVAEGIGSCNSMEEKYRWRKEWFKGRDGEEPPAGQDWEKIWIKGRNGQRGRWSWFRNKENDARWDLPNTILKMACKRAVVDGMLRSTRSSGIFTQDVEDMSPKLLQGREPEDFMDGDYREEPTQAAPAPQRTAQSTAQGARNSVPSSAQPGPIAEATRIAEHAMQARPPLEQGEITRLEDAVRAADSVPSLKSAHKNLMDAWPRIPRERHDKLNETIRIARGRVESKAQQATVEDDGLPPEDGDEAPVEHGGRPGIDPALPLDNDPSDDPF